MARKTEGAVAERKPRQRKSPKQKAESLTVRACNTIDSLGYMADKLTEPQRECIHSTISEKLKSLDAAFSQVDAEDETPEPFSLPD